MTKTTILITLANLSLAVFFLLIIKLIMKRSLRKFKEREKAIKELENCAYLYGKPGVGKSVINENLERALNNPFEIKKKKKQAKKKKFKKRK